MCRRQLSKQEPVNLITIPHVHINLAVAKYFYYFLIVTQLTLLPS